MHRVDCASALGVPLYPHTPSTMGWMPIPDMLDSSGRGLVNRKVMQLVMRRLKVPFVRRLF